MDVKGYEFFCLQKVMPLSLIYYYICCGSVVVPFVFTIHMVKLFTKALSHSLFVVVVRQT